jgi:hypothetical protein
MWVLIFSWFVTGQPVTSFQVQFATQVQCLSANIAYTNDFVRLSKLPPPVSDLTKSTTFISACVDTGRADN